MSSAWFCSAFLYKDLVLHRSQPYIYVHEYFRAIKGAVVRRKGNGVAQCGPTYAERSIAHSRTPPPRWRRRNLLLLEATWQQSRVRGAAGQRRILLLYLAPRPRSTSRRLVLTTQRRRKTQPTNSSSRKMLPSSFSQHLETLWSISFITFIFDYIYLCSLIN